MKIFYTLLLFLFCFALSACKPTTIQQKLEDAHTEWRITGYSDYEKKEGETEYQETLSFSEGKIYSTDLDDANIKIIWPYNLEGTSLKIIYNAQKNEGEVYSIKKDQNKFILEYLGTQQEDKLVKSPEYDRFLELSPIKTKDEKQPDQETASSNS